jgi:eukaryotic-like serine/threonine-protein kinase
MPENGQHISHYKILSAIGAGGMGEVYLAEDTRLNRKVAVKFLNEEFSRHGDNLNRFIQEAKAASALNHPNILTVYEIGESEGIHFIATEFIDGITLGEYAKSNSIPSTSALCWRRRSRSPRLWAKRIRQGSSIATSNPIM